MKYQAVIFDMDGTLLDTLRDLMNSVNFALEQHGAPRRTLEEIRGFVGNGVRTLITRSLGSADRPDFEEVFADFRRHYAEHCRDTTQPYPHILELVRELSARGYRLAIVSNKTDPEVKALNDEYFEGLFQSAVGECEGINRKPAPDTVLKTLRDLGLSREQAVYVGDSEVDVMTARNAGVDCIAVTWGFRSPEQLRQAGASVLLDDPRGMLELV